MGYKYLTGMPIHNLSQDLSIKLENEMIKKGNEHDELEKTTLVQLWLNELKAFEQIYAEFMGYKTISLLRNKNNNINDENKLINKEKTKK